MAGSNQPYVLHSAEGRPVSAPMGSDSGDFESAITHPWRKYCTSRWEFLPRLIPLFIFAFTILVMILVIDGKLKVQGGRAYQRTSVNGYSSLEQAGSTERVRYILRAWSSTQRLQAAFSSGLHFLFLFLYASTMTMACCWGVRAREGLFKYANLIP